MAPKKKNEDISRAEEPLASYGSEKLNFDKVWFLFKENEERMKETDEQMKETANTKDFMPVPF